MKKIYGIYANYIRFALLFICSFMTAPIIGQVKEVKNAPSPEVANLGTFGSIPVGHYTGTPNISIPLYTMKVGGFTFPLQAMYHTSNVKPHTPPSCLGIGWTLSAGGYIARSIKGTQDEKETYSTRAGFYFNHNKIDQIEKSSNKSQKLKEFTHLAGNDWYELAADEFSFSFNGYSGTFFMDKNGQWQVISDDNIKVEFNEQTGFKTIDDLAKRFSLQLYAVSENKRFFDKFTLITSDGTRYEFGGNNTTEYCIPFYNQVNGNIMATCWRLSKITTVDKRVINFEYAADSYMCDIHYAPQTISYYIDNKGYASRKDFGRAGYAGFLMMPSRLLKITSDNETIYFNYRRDTSYGNLFLYNTGCLYWVNRNRFGEEEARYMYGGLEKEFSKNRFSLFMGVAPLNSENATIDAIAKKITQDYLTSISVNKKNNKILGINCDFTLIRNRRLLSNIKFSMEESLQALTDDMENIIVLGQAKVIPENNRGISNMPSIRVDTERIPENLHAVVSNSLREEQPTTNDKTAFAEDLVYDNNDEPGGATKEYEYKFEYYLDSDQEKLWPVRSPLTYTDSWGYYSRYNSNPYNNGEWQLSTLYTKNDFKIRSASLMSTQVFALKSIVYPTGGMTSFEYELNDYSKVFHLQTNSMKEVSGTVGGLRVKSLKNYDVSGSLLYSKNYIYKNKLNGISSGISKGEPCFYDRIYFKENKSDYIDFYSFDDINPYPLNFNTPTVGYSIVFEELRDHDDKLLTRTKYQYTNYDMDINNKSHMDQPADYTANVYGSYASASFTSMAFERGKLTSKEIMDANNNVLEKNTFEYIRSAGAPYSTISHERHLDLYKELFAFSYLYKTYTNKYLVSVNRKQEIMTNGKFNTNIQYQYTNYGMPNSKIVSSDNGDIEYTSYKYSFDDPNYSWMTNYNILTPILTTKRQNNCLIQEKLIYSASNSGVPYISKKETIRSITNQNKSKTRIEFSVERADQYGNPVVWDENGIKTIMIWSHKGQKIVATIQNATYDEVTAALGKAPEDLSGLDFPLISFDLLRIKLNKALVYSYRYDVNLNLIGKTEPNGLSHIYTYDSLGRLTAEYRKVNGKLELLKSYKYNYSTK